MSPAAPRLSPRQHRLAAGRVLCAAVLVLVVVLTGTTAATADSVVPADTVPGSLLVTLTQDLAQAATGLAAVRAALRAGETTDILGAGVIRVQTHPGDEATRRAALRGVAGVMGVELDQLRRFDGLPDDRLVTQQWAHRVARSSAAWEFSSGATATIAILDSGIDARHRDLQTRVVEQVDASSGTVLPVPTGTNNDSCASGHGTRVAGIAAAAGGNGQDVAGVAWSAAIVDVALTSTRLGAVCDLVADSAVVAGLEYARTRAGGPVDVVNLSFGATGDACPLAFQSAIDALRAAGTTVVASAGNSSLDPATAAKPGVPASCEGVIAVGATGRTGQPADYSAANPWVDLVAPGGQAPYPDGCHGVAAECVLTTEYGGGVVAVEGTSYAAPYVAGVVGLIRDAVPQLAPAAVEAALFGTARDLGAAGRDDLSGWGLVRADAAILAARTNAAQAVADGRDAAAAARPFPVARRGAAILPLTSQENAVRVWGGESPSQPQATAIGVSRTVFADGGAAHVVITRTQRWTDGVAAAALGYGAGPLLLSDDGSLSPETAAELTRVLPRGGRVYLVGDVAALPGALATGLRIAGFSVVRLGAATPSGTAALAAEEAALRLPALGRALVTPVILASQDNWYDAVSAAPLAATLGAPILLTSAESLEVATRAALQQLAPPVLYVIGDEHAIPVAMAVRAAAIAGGAQIVRLAGHSRTTTVLAVDAELIQVLGPQARPAVAVAVNYGTGVASEILSAATIIGAYTGVIIPLIGADGSAIERQSLDLATAGATAALAVAVAGPDRVATAVLGRLAAAVAPPSDAR